MPSVTNLFCFTSDHLQKDRALHSLHAGPGHEDEVSSKMAEETQRWLYCILTSVLLLPLLQSCYTNSSADERRELMEEEEDHTYELLLTAQTKIPASTPESQSNKSMCVCVVILFSHLLLLYPGVISARW